MKSVIFFAILFGIISFCPISWPYPAYISDSFRISLREEDNIESRIMAFLSSGQPVEVVETKDGWTNIKVVDDENKPVSGWVLSRYLITSVPWEEQARKLGEENMRLTNEILSLEGKLTEAASTKKSFSDELTKSASLIETLKNKYDNLEKDASGYIHLKKQYEKTREILNKLSSENEDLRSVNSQRWFVMGALVLLCGFLVGIVIGRREKKLKSYY
ncbi:MAG: TIGR04211 family SH3 domain-containing protein [Deltaproteobacteria bacterium]|nr:TIGR04211 family SH3 domain-containing protein [Deltaproteobacteria bacterium]